jgi:integrase
VLSEAEIVALWRVCDEIGYPWGPLIQLLLLTGQREREVGDLVWSELGDLEKRVWSLPSSRTKNRRARIVHLSDLALEVIRKIPKFGEHDFVFSITGAKPVQSYGDVKVRIDRRLAELLGDVEPWVYHDLRRTCTTGMASFGIPLHVADKVLNHQSGVIRGVAAVYNKFDYREEKRDALNKWGEFVARLVGANIVALRAR